MYKLLSRPEVHSLLANQRLQNEETFIESLLKHLDKDEVAYGVDDMKLAVESGAVKELAVTEKFINTSREENTYDIIDSLLRRADSMQGKIHFLSSGSACKRVDGLGGIVGILQWKKA